MKCHLAHLQSSLCLSLAVAVLATGAVAEEPARQKAPDPVEENPFGQVELDPVPWLEGVTLPLTEGELLALFKKRQVAYTKEVHDDQITYTVKNGNKEFLCIGYKGGKFASFMHIRT